MGSDLRSRLHATIDELIDEIEGLRAPSGDEYRSDAPPTLTSRRAFNEVCRSGRVKGARKEGKVWLCSRVAWHRARAKRPELPRPEPPANDVDVADAMIAAAGFRVTAQGAR